MTVDHSRILFRNFFSQFSELVFFRRKIKMRGKKLWEIIPNVQNQRKNTIQNFLSVEVIWCSMFITYSACILKPNKDNTYVKKFVKSEQNWCPFKVEGPSLSSHLFELFFPHRVYPEMFQAIKYMAGYNKNYRKQQQTCGHSGWHVRLQKPRLKLWEVILNNLFFCLC